MKPKASSGKKRKASGNLSGSAAAPPQKRPRTRTSSLTDAVDEPMMMPEDESDDITSSSEIDEGSTIQQGTKIKNTNGVKRPLRIRALHAPQKPTNAVYLQMIRGPSVKIFVGSEKKCFEFPKELLSHYSPVFDRSFNGGFKEDQTQKMELPEDKIDDFEVFIEYVFHHGFGDQLSVSKCGEHTVERCFSFLKFADRYDLGDVSGGLCQSIRSALTKYGSSIFKPEYIELVFSLTKDGNCLRDLMAEAALAFQGKRGPWGRQEMSFKKQEIEVEGFEAAIYRALMRSRGSYANPFRLSEALFFDPN